MKLFNTLLVSTALLSASAFAQEQELAPAIDAAKEINESAALRNQQYVDSGRHLNIFRHPSVLGSLDLKEKSGERENEREGERTRTHR